MCFFLFKQKTAYEMRISDWSSDVCSSDLIRSAVRSVSTHRSAVPSSTNEIRSTKPGDSQMAEAFIIDAVRTPRGIGKVGKGALAHMHPQHLAATVLKAIHERNDFDTRDVDDAIGSAHVCTPVTNTHTVCRFLLEKKTKKTI